MKGRTVPPSVPARPATWGPWEWRNHLANHPRAPQGLRRACLNAVYSVQVFECATPWGLVEQASIRRHDGGTDVPWADKQRIKDELFGPERTAVEVYPARRDLVDDANLYHLWILPEGHELPFGLHKDAL